MTGNQFTIERRISSIENTISGAVFLYISLQLLPIVKPFGDEAVFLNVILTLALLAYTQAALAMLISQSAIRFLEFFWGKMSPQITKVQRHIPLLSPLLFMLILDLILWYMKIIGNELAVGGFILGIPALYRDEIIGAVKKRLLKPETHSAPSSDQPL